MKTRILSMAVMLALLTGCGNFLSENSQDEVRPSQVGDLEQMLLGEGYKSGNSIFYVTEIFTDNIRSCGVQDERFQSIQDNNKWLFQWSDNMFNDEGGGYNADVWENPYNCILGCNLVLDYLDSMDGDDNTRESLRGEALVLRAWYYLHLVNFFGIAYSQGNPSSDLGVPLKLNSEVTGDYFKRNTVAEVYDQIEHDLLEGNRLLEEHPYKRNIFRIGDTAAKAILARMYLYKEDWDKAIDYANQALAGKSTLLDLNTIPKGQIYNTFATVYSVKNPVEIIWARDYNQAVDLTINASVERPFVTSEEMPYDGTLRNYQDDEARDYRGIVYFYWQYTSTTQGWYRVCPSRGDMGDMSSYQGIRTAELYLDRAEAYAQKYKSSGSESDRQAALDNLNTLRRNRFNKAYYRDVDISDAQELLDFVIDERQRELVGETNNRWCDLRRYNKTVEHVLRNENNSQTFTKQMGRYVLPIPQAVIDANPDLIQN